MRIRIQNPESRIQSPESGFEIRDSKFSRKASTLLLALLVLSTMLIITISVAEVAHTELLISRTTDNATTAVYAAESSVEEGVYRIRKVDGATVASLDGTQATLGNSATWNRVATSNEPGGLYIPFLQKDRSYGFDLYDPESGTSADKNSLVIRPYCQGGEWLELGFTTWTPGTAFNQNFTKFRYPCPTVSVPGDGTIVNNFISGGNSYRMYVRSLTADMPGARVLACTNPDATGICDMPGRVSITATGTYHGTKRALTVSMPRIAPVAGLFSYAIFSQCSLIKDVSTYPVPAPPCP